MFRYIQILYSFVIRDALIEMSYRFDFALRLLTIITQILLLYFISILIGSHPSLDQYGGYLPFGVIGLAVISYFEIGYNSFSSSIRREQMMGTLEALLMMPVNINLLILGTSMWNFIWAFAVMIIYLFTATLLYPIEYQGNYLLALFLLFLTTMFFADLGIISAGFIMVFKKGNPLSLFMGSVSGLIGGAFFPIEIMPSWLQTISHFHPLTYSLNALRNVLLKGEPLSVIAPDLIVLLGVVSVLTPISLYCFRLSVRYAQREGSLIQY